MAGIQSLAFRLGVLICMSGPLLAQDEQTPSTAFPLVDSPPASSLPTVDLAHEFWVADASPPAGDSEAFESLEAASSLPGYFVQTEAARASLPLGQPTATEPIAAVHGLEEISLRAGYDNGFIIASQTNRSLGADHYAYVLAVNGYGQLRNTNFSSNDPADDVNQLQLKRARLILSGHAVNPDFKYVFQFDGRSSSGDMVRLLDYYVTLDIGHHYWGLPRGSFGFKLGKYKMPFSLARHLSGKHLQFSDRSMASAYFDVNRSLAGGISGSTPGLARPVHWEVALFNGLVTGGAETGSSGTLDNNNAFSARLSCFPFGEWGESELSDFRVQQSLATRIGAGAAFTTIDRSGTTEFSALRVVDSGRELSSLLPLSVQQYSVALFAVDASMKLWGGSLTSEYYFRNVNSFVGADIPTLYDHGLWLQAGKFVVPDQLELLARWSRVQGNSGSLGTVTQSSDEIGVGAVMYFAKQNGKFTFDTSYVNGAPINSATLDLFPGDTGWLFRGQMQFSF